MDGLRDDVISFAGAGFIGCRARRFLYRRDFWVPSWDRADESKAAPMDCLDQRVFWCRRSDLNRGPDYE